MNINLLLNGNTIAFEGNKQVPIAQKSWLMCYVEYLASQGLEPEKHAYIMGGQKIKIIKAEIDGEVFYNWEMI